jgi:hypothetical protein
MTSLPAPLPAQETSAPARVTNRLGLFLAGLVLPLASPAFYRRVLRQSAGRSVVFFLVFSSLVALFLTAEIVAGMGMAQTGIQQAFAAGTWPVITIENGVARVRGTQPAVLVDEGGMFMAIDTTGRFTRIDPGRYAQGMLLTYDSLHVLNQGEYQVIPLSDLQTLFNANPLIVDENTVLQAWNTISVLISGGAMVALFIWHLGVRLVYLLVLAWIMRKALELFSSSLPFSAVLTIGIYAYVPASYLGYLLSHLRVSFFALQTLLILVFWAIGLWHALRAGSLVPRLRHAALGLPLLAVLVAIGLTRWTWGAVVGLGLFFATILLLVGADMLASEDEPTPASA